MGAIEVFCIALAASLPAALPLLLIHDPWLALRTSNLLVVGLLFVVAYQWARGRRVSGSWVSAWRWSRSSSC
jgi:VIT1/CCC1 family predicted Fe2+/Mn2+ transporter